MSSLKDEELDQTTVNLLQKGLNFSVTLKKVPTEEIICSVEIAVKNLSPEVKEMPCTS